MSRFNVKPSNIDAAVADLQGKARSIQPIIDTISGVKNNLTFQTASANSVQTQLANVRTDIANEMQILTRMGTVLDDVLTRYKKAEEKNLSLEDILKSFRHLEREQKEREQGSGATIHWDEEYGGFVDDETIHANEDSWLGKTPVGSFVNKVNGFFEGLQQEATTSVNEKTRGCRIP